MSIAGFPSPLESLLVTAAYEGIKQGVGRFRRSSLQKGVEAAADKIAADRQISPDLFILLFEQKEVEKAVEQFKQNGSPIPRTTLLKCLQKDIDPELDSEELLDEFLKIFQRQICDDPEIWRKIELQYSQEESKQLTEIEKGLEDLWEEINNNHTDIYESHLWTEGFRRLNPVFFHNQSDPPHIGWRAGFSIPDIKEGLALERQYSKNGQRYSFDRKIMQGLEESKDQIILGSPGSGKSSVCKSVAVSYYEEKEGTVFYRESNQGSEFRNTGSLLNEINNAEGPVLVVVEDITDKQSMTILSLAHEFRNNTNVNFLFDSTMADWQKFDERIENNREKHYKRTEIKENRIPSLDKKEYKRIVNHFEISTNNVGTPNYEELYEELSNSSSNTNLETVAPGEMYLLSHRLSQYLKTENDPYASDNVLEFSTLTEEVSGIIVRLENEDNREMAEKLAILINVLNVSRIGIQKELLHSIAADQDQHRLIERLLDQFKGEIVFERSHGSLTTNHELWSIRFLTVFLDREDMVCVNYFEDVVNSMFRMVDNKEKQQEIKQWIHSTPRIIRDINDDPEKTADFLLNRIFSIGRRYPNLSPLYKRSDESNIEKPESCSPRMDIQTFIWRGEIFARSYNEEDGLYEFNCLLRAAEVKKDHQEVANSLAGMGMGNIGVIALDHGHLEIAETVLYQAYKLAGETNNIDHEILAMSNLGQLEQKRGEYKRAKKCFEDALKKGEQINDKKLQGKCLIDLGNLLERQADQESGFQSKQLYKEAKNCHEKAKSIGEELGERFMQASALSNLSNIYVALDDESTAEAYLRQALSIFREYGEKGKEGTALTNLGAILLIQGKYDPAEDMFWESFQIAQETKNPSSLLINLYNLARVEIKRPDGDLKKAKTRLETAIGICEEKNIIEHKNTILDQLVSVCRELGQNEEAMEWEQKKTD